MVFPVGDTFSSSWKTVARGSGFGSMRAVEALLVLRTVAQLPCLFDGTFSEVSLSCGWKDQCGEVESWTTLMVRTYQELSKPYRQACLLHSEIMENER